MRTEKAMKCSFTWENRTSTMPHPHELFGIELHHCGQQGKHSFHRCRYCERYRRNPQIEPHGKRDNVNQKPLPRHPWCWTNLFPLEKHPEQCQQCYELWERFPRIVVESTEEE